ncbi:MAG: helix-turn-helix transcriptional regulator [Clostridia bacterium]|nr:helix-turn-helix transcriptional regulator [Clostridia bacterium]MBR0407829.1 helix-turn-helix transcriptional regulator [Clostridia bacterium]
MYKNRAKDGRNNITGRAIARYRLQMPDNPSQNGLAALLQVNGLDLDKNAIQRIECGKRFVTDIELKTIAKVLQVSYSDLLDDETAEANESRAR